MLAAATDLQMPAAAQQQPSVLCPKKVRSKYTELNIFIAVLIINHKITHKITHFNKIYSTVSEKHSTVELKLSRVSGVNAPVGSRDPVYNSCAVELLRLVIMTT